MKFIKCVIAVIEKNFGSILIAIAIIAAAMIYAYYNPYKSCKRDLIGRYNDSGAAVVCSGSTVVNP